MVDILSRFGIQCQVFLTYYGPPCFTCGSKFSKLHSLDKDAVILLWPSFPIKEMALKFCPVTKVPSSLLKKIPHHQQSRGQKPPVVTGNMDKILPCHSLSICLLPPLSCRFRCSPRCPPKRARNSPTSLPIHWPPPPHWPPQPRPPQMTGRRINWSISQRLRAYLSEGDDLNNQLFHFQLLV